MPSGPSKRKLRQDQFLGNDASATANLSVALLAGAGALLRVALQDRADQVYRTRDDHFAVHGPGSVILFVASLEAFVNEVIEDISFRRW
jgi:hypothetical protein